MTFTYKHTIYASYIAFITQAIINNLAPLLFLTFRNQFNISLKSISFLITLNFFIQLLTDLLSTQFVDKIGHRKCMVLAHIVSILGLLSFSILPFLFSNAYIGLMISVSLSAIGSGLIEVLANPIVTSVPNQSSSAAITLLHAFYCIGQVFVVLGSTIFFTVFGVENWRYLPILWAIIPLLNTFLYANVPFGTFVKEENRIPMKKLFSSKAFLILLVLMVVAGASEMSISQWASFFAEAGLKVSKSMGDLLGPMLFAVLMGSMRIFYGIKGESLNIRKALIFSSALCIFSYLLTVFAPIPLLSLIGCALCGLAVGFMWPGVVSLLNEYFADGGTATFALLAFAGDIGCSFGPWIVGLISNTVEQSNFSLLAPLITSNGSTDLGLKSGLCAIVIFPVLMILGLKILKKGKEV